MTNPKKKSEELLPALVLLALGIPFVFLFVRAMVDGEQQRREAPVRALIGDDAYEELAQGNNTPLHYMGRSLSAPDFSLPDRHGKPWRLRDQRGKVVVMNFWTITCQPCVEEMPSLVQLAQLAAKRQDLEVVAVTSDKDWSEIASIMPPDSRLKVLFDPDKRVIAGKFGSKLFPETWIIDSSGIIRLRVDGPRDWAGPLVLDVVERYL